MMIFIAWTHGDNFRTLLFQFIIFICMIHNIGVDIVIDAIDCFESKKISFIGSSMMIFFIFHGRMVKQWFHGGGALV